MRNGFVFAGKASSDFGLYVERYPQQGAPSRKVTTVSVPGRNGDLHFCDGSFENYEQVYKCYFRGCSAMPVHAHAVKEWLMGTTRYQRLEDAYDPDHFRLAVYNGPMDIENHLNRYGRCKVKFDCKPQSYLKSGEIPVAFTSANELHNSTAFPAKPLITVYGTGAGTLTIGATTVEIKAMEDVLILDSETENAYRQVGNGAPENKNRDIYAPVFPELLSGSNAVSWTGDITKIEIIPRWWTL